MKAEAAMEVVGSKAVMKVMEAPIATVIWVAVIAAGVLGYATTSAGRAQTTSA